MNFRSLMNRGNFVLMGTLCIVLTYRILIAFNYTPELWNGETNNVWNALKVANGGALYTNPEALPFEIFQYTPLSQFPLIAAAFLIDHQSTEYYYQVMVTGRLINLLLNLCTFYLVFLMMRRQFQVDSRIALLTAILGFSVLTHASFAIRPDALAFFFTILAVYFFGEAYFRERTRHYYTTGIVFAISFFAKQDAFLILAALGLVLLLGREIKTILIIAVSFALSMTLLILLSRLIFGPFFLISIFGGLNVSAEFGKFAYILERYFMFYMVLFTIAVFSFFYLLRKENRSRTTNYLLIICSMAFLIAAVSSSKLGSHINYYTLSTTLNLMMIGFVIHRLTMHKELDHFLPAIGIAGSLTVSYFLFLQVFHYTSPFLKYGASKAMHTARIADYSSFKKLIDAKNTTLYTVDYDLKLLFFTASVFPNTEYYPVSKFNYKQVVKPGELTHFIVKKDLPDEQLLTFDIFGIDTSDYIKIKENSNYTIYSYEH